MELCLSFRVCFVEGFSFLFNVLASTACSCVYCICQTFCLIFLEIWGRDASLCFGARVGAYRAFPLVFFVADVFRLLVSFVVLACSGSGCWYAPCRRYSCIGTHQDVSVDPAGVSCQGEGGFRIPLLVGQGVFSVCCVCVFCRCVSVLCLCVAREALECISFAFRAVI